MYLYFMKGGGGGGRWLSVFMSKDMGGGLLEGGGLHERVRYVKSCSKFFRYFET